MIKLNSFLYTWFYVMLATAILGAVTALPIIASIYIHAAVGLVIVFLYITALSAFILETWE